ncbi:hypothetical protein [uncultured Methanobrevibacter sp.]|uniref:hypothetical protein n=1 Tax=uncultured Methanobrevibacter sp. TaxID=253161 RepID=UPI0025DA2ADF|nr:hypothetical protein [uncultured Methanobrevibacter sp.]
MNNKILNSIHKISEDTVDSNKTMVDEILNNIYKIPENIFDSNKTIVDEKCSYEGHLYNQGITMCGLEQPNNADIKHCGPKCPEYCPIIIISTVKTASLDKIEQVITLSSNDETVSEK